MAKHDRMLRKIMRKKEEKVEQVDWYSDKGVAGNDENVKEQIITRAKLVKKKVDILARDLLLLLTQSKEAPIGRSVIQKARNKIASLKNYESILEELDKKAEAAHIGFIGEWTIGRLKSKVNKLIQVNTKKLGRIAS